MIAVLFAAATASLLRPSPVTTSRRAVISGAGAAAAAVLPRYPALAAAPELYAPKAGSLTGETILITGANTGLGLESAKRLAGGGAKIVVTARTKDKVASTIADVRAATGAPASQVLGGELDLASLESVKSLPTRLASVLGDAAPIDCLLNNAGVMAIPERLSTADGFERTVGVNHLGHFALVGSLLPSLKLAPKGFRVVTVSSDAHKFVTKKSLDEALEANLDPPEYSTWGSYGLSKAANILFTVELQRRLDAAGVPGSAVALHPGVVQTDLARYIIGGVEAGDTRLSETAPPPTGISKALKEGVLDKVVLPVAKGANTQVFLAAAADNADGALAKRTDGFYFDVMKPAKPTDVATDATAARQLWELSEKLTGVKMGI